MPARFGVRYKGMWHKLKQAGKAIPCPPVRLYKISLPGGAVWMPFPNRR